MPPSACLNLLQAPLEIKKNVSHYCIFQVQNFHLVPFNTIGLFIDTLYLVREHSDSLL